MTDLTKCFPLITIHYFDIGTFSFNHARVALRVPPDRPGFTISFVDDEGMIDNVQWSLDGFSGLCIHRTASP